ncbi:MAG: EF-P 5-aminopentanol modification-associated protein YfmF [Clostridia bacterium]
MKYTRITLYIFSILYYNKQRCTKKEEENLWKIKEWGGITLHIIPTNLFKTNLLAVFLTMPLERKTVTKNALITAVLRRGTMQMPTQESISQNLEQMYGAAFDCGIEKIGDNHTIKFYLETINDKFLPKQENNLVKGMETLLDIVFNPLVEEGMFKQQYLQEEKNSLKQMIEGKIDNKGMYALERCIEEMYKDKPYGLYKLGYIEDLEQIQSKELYSYYQEMIENCKVDIFISGEIEPQIVEQIKTNVNLQKLNSRKKIIAQDNELKPEITTPKEIQENMQITQGKLIIGLDVQAEEKQVGYITSLYNTILGVGANSKLFQNVREKASLAYTASSSYIKRKQNIFIRAGIEIENYEKALAIIKQQLEDMKKGAFSEEDIQKAKNLVIATIENIPEEQDTQLTYYFGQELTNTQISIEEYKQKIQEVTKKQIVDIANKIQIDTIFFLNGEN